jgi:hypothetical protein
VLGVGARKTGRATFGTAGILVRDRIERAVDMLDRARGDLFVESNCTITERTQVGVVATVLTRNLSNYKIRVTKNSQVSDTMSVSAAEPVN